MKVKIKRPFIYNGAALRPGDEVEMADPKRAVRHMLAGDIERDEKAVIDYKNKMIAEGEAKIKAAAKF